MTNTTKFTFSDVAAEAVAIFERYDFTPSEDFDGWSLMSEDTLVYLEATAVIDSAREEVCVEVFRFNGQSRMQIELPWARFLRAPRDAHPDASFLDAVDEAVLDAVRMLRSEERRVRSF